MEHGARQTKDLVTHFACVVVLLAAAGVYSISANAPQTLLIVTLGLTVSAVVRRPLRYSSRFIAYSMIASLILAAFETEFFPVPTGRFFLLPADTYCPAFLYAATALTLFDQRETILGSIAALALLAVLLAGNTLGTGTGTEPGVTAALLQNFYEVYTAAVAVELVGLLALMRVMARGRLQEGEPHALMRKRLLHAATLGAGVVLAVGLTAAGRYYEGRWAGLFNRLFSQYLQRGPSRVVFGREADLWRTLPLRRNSDETVVLRVVSEESPGYLRGRVFLDYAAGRWSGAHPTRMLDAELPGGQRVFHRYQRPLPRTPGADTEWITVFPSLQIEGDILFAPGNASVFELVVEGLRNNPDGVLTQEYWDQRVGCRIGRAVELNSESYILPRPGRDTERWRYLALPRDLRTRLNGIGDQVFSRPAEQSTTLEDVAEIMAYFREHFRYSLTPRRFGPDGDDPVLQFVEHWQEGHCELFAASAALLLRSRGIPTRYVTGLVCQEKGLGDSWTARLRDAHAWVEAFDAERNVWMLVEATPAEGVPLGDRGPGFLALLAERIALSIQELLAHVRRGDVAQGIANALITLLAWAILVLSSPFFWMVCLPAALLYWRHWYRLRLRRMGLPGEDEKLLTLRTEFLRLERKAARLGVVRAPGETPAALAQRLADMDEVARDLVILLRDFEILRYDTQARDSDKVADFAKRVRALR